jgi:uncharacterized protein (TIGR03492 family)
MIAIASNGFGETYVALGIARELAKKGSKTLLFPLIGNIKGVSDEVELCFVPNETRFGGFAFWSFSNFIRTILSPFDSKNEISNFLNFVKQLRKNKDRIDKVLVVGDPFLLFVVKKSLSKGTKVAFLSLFKSEITERHFWFEKKFIKRNVDVLITRDEYTAEVFKKLGVNAVFFGNPMVSSIDIKGIDLRENKELKTLLLLPGSREYYAYGVLVKMLYVVEAIVEKYGFINVLCALSDTISKERVKENVIKHDWEIIDKDDNIFLLSKGLIRVLCGYGIFGDMLNVCDVVLSVGGTATEQASGLGKPSVMFYDSSTGININWFKRQEKMLGESVKIFYKFSINEISNEIIHLFTNESERRRRGEIGKKLMYDNNSTQKIAELLISI